MPQQNLYYKTEDLPEVFTLVTPQNSWFQKLRRKFFAFLFTFANFLFMKRKVVPPVEDHVLLLSAVKLAEKIRNKEVRLFLKTIYFLIQIPKQFQLTSERIVTAYINRIKQVNPIINAVVQTKYSLSLQQARGVDKQIEHLSSKDIEILQQEKPFLGIPFTVKDNYFIKGYFHVTNYLITGFILIQGNFVFLLF